MVEYTHFLLDIDFLLVFVQKYQHILCYVIVLLCVSREGAGMLLAVNTDGERPHGDQQWTVL